jgi:hypothetical protein
MSPQTRRAPRPARRTTILAAASQSKRSLASPTPRPQHTTAVALEQASTQHAFDLDLISPYHLHQCLRALGRTLSKSPAK